MGGIYEDTPLLPVIVAEAVCMEAGDLLNYLNPAVSPAGRLVEKAEESYANSPSFRKTLNGAGNKGRDALYDFMRASLVRRLLAAGCTESELRTSKLGESRYACAADTKLDQKEKQF